MFDPLILSVFIMIPILGILLSSVFTIFIQSKRLLIIEQLGSILIFFSNVILIFIMALSFGIGANIPSTISDYFSINLLSLMVLVLVQLVFFLVSVFSLRYISLEKQAQYFIFLFSMNLGINLTLLSNNLFVLFVCWELMVISGYVLVSFNRTIKAFEAGFKYLIISSIGSLFMLLGIGILTGLVGSLNFSDITAQSVLTNDLGKLAFSFIFIGFATTGGAFLFNQWLPDAHPEAPAPVSALLSGIIVNIGIYGIFKLFTIFSVSKADYTTDFSKVVLLIGLLTMFEGSILVFVQFKKEFIDIKRILAYSTISHMGLLITITPLGSNISFLALIYHIISHSLSKSLLFLMAGYLQLTYHTRDVKLLSGAGRRDKLTGIVMMIGLLSLGAFPGTSGFISEILVFIAIFGSGLTVNSNVFLIIILLVILNSVLSFSGYLWLIKYLVFNEESEIVKATTNTLNNETIIKYTVLEIALLIIFLGLFPNVLINFITQLLPVVP